MELKEFLKRTINEAMDAVVEVNVERAKANKKGRLNPKAPKQGEDFEIDTIEFDVAVTAGETKQGSFGGVLRGDTDGDKIADFEIAVNGPLVAADIIL